MLLLPKFYIPAEDAVILFQFSRNLARTGAITFISGGPHAEGATDFAWMVLISAGIKLGIDPFWLVALINFGAILLFAVLLIRLAGSRVTALPMLFIMGSFALLPQFWSACAGFSTIPFACILVVLTWSFLKKNDIALPAVGLLLCLFRPDGVVFAIPLMVAALIIYPNRWRRLGLDTAFFVVPGLAYFFWRWHYFGQLLPLPFLVKSDAVRWAHVLVLDSLRESKPLCLLTLVLLYFVLRGRMSDVRNKAVLWCLILLPNLFYFSMRLDQDVGMRFFIYLPVGTAILIAMNWQGLKPQRSLILRVGLAAWLILLFHTSFKDGHGSWAFQLTNRKAVSEDLAHLPHGTLLTTEAGIAPYYSGWASYDSWGLSTERFATHLLQPSDVVDLRPDLVLMHTGQDPECVAQKDWQTPYTGRTWDHMTRNLVAGADPEHYDLWLVPRGNANDRLRMKLQNWEGDEDCWLIRRDSPMEAELTAVMIRHLGTPAANYYSHFPVKGGSTLSDATVARSEKQHPIHAALKKAWHWLD